MKKAQLNEEMEASQEKIAELECTQAEHKRVEEALRESEATARALLNALTDLVFLIDARGIILALNETAVQRFGRPSDELLGLCAYDLLPPDLAEHRKAQADKVFRSGKPVRFEDECAGTWFDNVVYPVFDARGEVTKVAVVARDITERKRVEEMKDNLIRDVSHELKTPLAKMQMSVEQLMETVGAPSIDRQKAARASKIVADNVQRLQHTVNSILDLSSLESGQMPYHKTKVQSENLIGQVIMDMQSLAEAKGLELVAELPEDLPQVEGDGEKLLRVLTNLVDNAVKFTDQGKIVISAEKKAHEVEIAVSDPGYGILRENLGRVFERFHQERASIPGAGVGLAICKAIVEAHGGNILAESAGRGQGTTIRFTLPMLKPGEGEAISRNVKRGT